MKYLNVVFLMATIGFATYQFIGANQVMAGAKESYEKTLTGKAIFIDVREKAELEGGMIKGAVSFPLSEIEKDPKGSAAKIKEMAQGKEIYLYCRSGNRSGLVKEYLKKEGIEAVNAGGFSALAGEKIPTTSGSK